MTNESEHEQHYITNGGGERIQTIGKATNEDEELFYGNNEFRAGRGRSHCRLFAQPQKSSPQIHRSIDTTWLNSDLPFVWKI